ncbi:MAG: molybdopterin-guanine dinucleotide biosynthesis protein B [Deltaproteobacteria bacterium RIFOXYD12_FULL_57_12]|nr:MAG: molybdopterin-guanine dinucleotide biosynthesis protein B [Deltaproteobacteria bacterium RIFOXYD12_FULL_57_12]
MAPVVSLIGRPNSGKTTILEKLIPVLVGQGTRIGTIKHHVHGDFCMDVPGKDTWRHRQAGAAVVALSSPSGLGIIRRTSRDTELAELVDRYFFDMDLVLTEGYKKAAAPKIEVFRSTLHTDPLPDPDSTLIAMVSDVDVGRNLPCFHHDDISGLAAFVTARFLTAPSLAAEVTVSLAIDGRPLLLTVAEADLLRQVVQEKILGRTERLHQPAIRLCLD